MSYPRFRRARAHKTVRHTSGDIAVTSTTLVALDTALDLTLEAQVGDTVEVGVIGAWSNEAIVGVLDVATWVSSAAVNYFSNGTATPAANGVPGWYGPASAVTPVSGPAFHTLVAGDIASGLVTVRLLTKVGSAGTRTMLGTSATSPVQVYAKNLGPVDPH